MLWVDWIMVASDVVTGGFAFWLAAMFWRDGHLIGWPRARLMSAVFAGLGALALLQAGLIVLKASGTTSC